MRALVAALLTAVVLLSAAGPHVHAGAQGTERCPACVVRAADVAHDETPDLAPRPLFAVEVPAAPGLPPVSGAPIGAIPGQSPPRA